VNNNCEQLALDNNWSLTRKNACHISVQNEEMGTLSEAQVKMEYKLQNIEIYIEINMWIWGVIAATIIAIAIKKIFKK